MGIAEHRIERLGEKENLVVLRGREDERERRRERVKGEKREKDLRRICKG